jgi:3-dehydroquinate dehydratase
VNEQEKIAELEKKIDELESQLIDLTFTLNYNKETELLEFVRELFISLQNVDEKLSKEEIVENLRNYIKGFAKNNKLLL